MYRIGEFSVLSKTTIKTLRYYEKEGLLIPSYVDNISGYRFYEAKQLMILAKIVSLRQIGMSIQDIKMIVYEENVEELLHKRKNELEAEISLYSDQLQRLNYLLEGKDMQYEVIKKELPEYTIYYKEGVIKDFSKIVEFILSSEKEFRKSNPQIQYVKPDYCYVNYLDGEYRDQDIAIRYAQAVNEEGVSNETIHFEKLKAVEAVCIYHKGAFENIRDAYIFIMKWIEDNGYEIVESPRERYIDGIWNKDKEEDYLTEIQVPVKKIS